MGETGTYKQILTINQVFDILLQYHESGSWVSAFHRNIPPKTGFVLKKEYSEEISKLQRNKESFSCSECGKQFAFRSILERHIIKHKDQRPFHCMQCGKKLKSGISLQRHMKGHLRIFDYKCENCSRRSSPLDYRGIFTHFASCKFSCSYF